MKRDIECGARIVVKKWMRVKPWDRLLIVTNDRYIEEVNTIKVYAKSRARCVDLMIV